MLQPSIDLLFQRRFGSVHEKIKLFRRGGRRGTGFVSRDAKKKNTSVLIRIVCALFLLRLSPPLTKVLSDIALSSSATHSPNLCAVALTHCHRVHFCSPGLTPPCCAIGPHPWSCNRTLTPSSARRPALAHTSMSPTKTASHFVEFHR